MPGRSVIQWDKDDAAAVGLVKFDLLGLGMLSVLHYAADLVAAHHGVRVKLHDLQPVDAENPAAVVNVGGSLGGQFLLWETATAVAGYLLGINPFDQPDVESAKKAARQQMSGGAGGSSEPALVASEVEVRAEGGFLGDADSVQQAVDALLGISL